MKKLIIFAVAIVGGMTITSRADEQPSTSTSEQSVYQIAENHYSDSLIYIKKESVSLNLLRYMLSQGASIDDIEQGIYKVNGKRICIK